jgi:type IX secretion system PorP/SprF family membrane protein
MKKTLVAYLIILLAATGSQAQQRMQYSQFMQNAFLLNPALCGIEKYNDLKTGFASQWNGFDGPKGTFLTTQFSFASDTDVAEEPIQDLPMRGRKQVVKSKNEILMPDTTHPAFKHGWGLQAFNEGDDVISQTEISAAYGAHFLMKKQNYFSAGISFGLRQNTFNPAGIRLLNPNDLVFAGGTRNLILPTINLGISFYNRRWFAALSTVQVLNNSYSYDGKDPNKPSRLQPHTYLIGGYRFAMKGLVSFTPSFILRYAHPSAPSIDLNGMLDYKDQFRFGLSYRNKESVVALFGFVIAHRIGIHYSFDFISSPIKNYSSGTHGLFLSVRLGSNKTPIPAYFW